MESCKLRYFNSFEFFDHVGSAPNVAMSLPSDIQPASSIHRVPTSRRRSAACSDILRITDCSILVVVAKQRQVDRVGHGPVAAIVRMQMIAAVIRRQQA